MDSPSGEIPDRSPPRIYLHFMAFTALLAGFAFGMSVVGRWSQLHEAPILFAVAWIPPFLVEAFRFLKVDRLIWPAMILSSLFGYMLGR